MASGSITSPSHRRENSGNSGWLYFGGLQNHCRWWLQPWCEEMIHLKRPWCWERLKARGGGDDRGWDGWMASPWTWVWVTPGVSNGQGGLVCCSLWGCKESVLCVRWPKYWHFSFNISPSNEHSGLISFRMDWLDLLAVQGTLKSLLQHHSSKASILWCLWSNSNIHTWLLEKP